MGYRIVIKGGYGLTNFGDDALMYVLSLRLKEHFRSNEIAFACYDNKHNKEFSNGFCIESVVNFKSIKTDFLVYGGGTQFYSFKPKRSFLRVILSTIKQIVLNPKKLIKQKSSTVQVEQFENLAAIGIGVGPFLQGSDFSVEKDAKISFSKMSFVAVRDTFSLKKMEEWGIKSEGLNTDICYLLDKKPLFHQKSIKIKKIGIVVRDWNLTSEGKAYYNQIKPLIEQLEKESFDITLIIFAKDSDQFWNNKKQEFKNVLEWEYGKVSIQDFMDDMQSFDLIITARYHGAIFASLLNIPFISIVVEQKLSLISEVYKDSSEKWEYPFNINECMKKIKKIDDTYLSRLGDIEKVTSLEQQKATIMFNKFIKYIKSTNISKTKG